MKRATVTSMSFALCMCTALAAIRADDRKAAAEHFALAESAEKRKDWRAAIAEYELAYKASPHPSVLFNIAADYERLDEGRSAATYFTRYLRESKDPSDRDGVKQRIDRLAAKVSRVRIAAKPAGASVFVDTVNRGDAPLTLEIPAGAHEIYVAAGGRSSRSRRVVLEYGEPITVQFDLDSREGMLAVFTNVRGAEVKVDGQVVGRTPFSGRIPAGDHEVLISMAGYDSVQRNVTVAPEGSRQIRADLARVGGQPERPTEPGKYLFGTAYGLDVNGGSGLRYLVELGYRAASNRWDASLVVGAFGNGAGGGAGFAGRLFLATKRLRPYLRVGLLAASTTSAGDDRITLLEGGGGLLVMGRSMGSRGSRTTSRSHRRFSLDYFVEINVSLRLQKPDVDEARVGIPIVGGILFRFGG